MVFFWRFRLCYHLNGSHRKVKHFCGTLSIRFENKFHYYIICRNANVGSSFHSSYAAQYSTVRYTLKSISFDGNVILRTDPKMCKKKKHLFDITCDAFPILFFIFKLSATFMGFEVFLLHNFHIYHLLFNTSALVLSLPCSYSDFSQRQFNLIHIKLSKLRHNNKSQECFEALCF